MTDLESYNFTPINNHLLNKYKDTYLANQIWSDYIKKATNSIYKSEYDNFIIYSAISAESFIKELVSVFFQ